MASYHYNKSKGGMVKCNTVDPNGVCRIHGNTDIQANSAEEAQHKYNAMKRDEANAEDMSEMPLEYATEAWKIHCDSINEGNDDGMGPKTIDAIAHKPGVWESLNDDEKNIMINHYTVDNGNGYKEIADNAPDGVMESYGYSHSLDVVRKAYDYLYSLYDEDELQDDADLLVDDCSHADDGLNIRGGVAIPSVFKRRNDDTDVFVNYPVDDRMYESMWNTYVENSLNAGYEVSDDEYDDYMDAMFAK